MGIDADVFPAEPTSEPKLKSNVHRLPRSDLDSLSEISLFGQAILDAANEDPCWVWRPSIAAGSMVTIGGPPTSGKSSLLFRLLVARASERILQVLERDVTPAPEAQFIIVIEEESRRRTSRRIMRAINEFGGLEAKKICDRFRILTSERAINVGDSTWARIERLVRQGVVSDVVIDTLASATTEAANDEQAQAQLYRKFKRLLGAYPNSTHLPHPVLWLLAHTRKADANTKDQGEALSGSRQRVAQTDTLLMLESVYGGNGLHIASVCHFAKERDNFDDEPSKPVKFDRQGRIKRKAGHGAQPVTLQGLLEVLAKPGPHTLRTLREALHAGPTAVRAAIVEGEAQNLVKRHSELIEGNPTEVFRGVGGS